MEISRFFKDLDKKLRPFINDGLVKRIYVSGGDLLCWDEATVKEFGNYLMLYFVDLETWLFTGAEQEELPYWIWWYFWVVKCGPYREDLRNPEGTFPASSNQKLVVFYKLPRDYFNDIEFQGVKTWS